MMKSTDQSRRSLLQSAVGLAIAGIAVAGGLAAPIRALAASGRQAFEDKDLPRVLADIDAQSAIPTSDVIIRAPEIAENGAVVPIDITSNIPDTESISIVAEKNPFPLTAEFRFENGAEPYVSTRIKLGQTSTVRALVKSRGKTYVATRLVKVTIGGCGG